MRLDAKMRAAVVLGAVLSWPVLRAVGDGSIDPGAAAIRVAMALALAYGAVLLLVRVVGGYLPESAPEVEPAAADGVEDAFIVEDDAPAES